MRLPRPRPTSAPTAGIQAGIETHIEEQVRLGGGYFKLPFRNRELRLKLVRVHTEYLAKLGPGRYFACVDLADISGDVYDVDFFLAGDPAAMKVTETTVHKLNGQPFYAWEQKSDGTWQRLPLKEASEGHLGVIRGRDEFEFLYRATLPKITGSRPHVASSGRHGPVPGSAGRSSMPTASGGRLDISEGNKYTSLATYYFGHHPANRSRTQPRPLTW